MISPKLLRSSAVATFSLLTLFACERTERQGEDAAEDMSGPTPSTGTTEAEGSRATGTTGSRDTMEGTGTERSPGTGSATDTTSSEAIERTGGRDMPMGSGGSGAMRMGTGGHGGKAGAGGKGSSMR